MDVWKYEIISRVEQDISNSLIIHKIETKEINTETEFRYVMEHLHKIKPTFISIFPLNTNLFEMLYQTLGRVFHQDIQTPRSFSTHFSVFGYPDETLFLVFGILHLTRLLCSLVRYPGQFS